MNAPSLPPRSQTAMTTFHLTARPLPQPPQPSMHRSTASSPPHMPRCMTLLQHGEPVCQSKHRVCTNCPAAGLRTRCCCLKVRLCQAPSILTLPTCTSSTHPRGSLHSRLSSGTCLSATTSPPRLAATAPIRCPARPEGQRPQRQT